MSDIIYRTFRTPKGCYVYDRSVNSIFAVSTPDFETLRVEQNSNGHSPDLIARYQKLGLLNSNSVDTIEHPASDVLCHYCTNRIEFLLLQVTQQCNLRCSYCAYSGMYYNREHNSQRMSFDTAKRAIDFCLSNTAEMDSIHFGFYGGEPLLEFDLIQQCVAYIEGIVEGKKATFGLTTNGTLLTDDKVHFFHKHNFALTISLDGSKREHDACRVFRNGQGSFDIIMRNIARLKELYPEYAEGLLISTVISPSADMNHVLEYFKSDDVLSDTHIIMNPISPTGLKEKVDYEESFYLVRQYEFLKFLLYLIEKIDRQYISDLVLQSQRVLQNLYRALQTHAQIPHCTHHGGPCLPGVQRLFVSVNGDFYPCEKVSETAPGVNIGSINSGFDLEKMYKLLNLGSLSAEECKKCWALPNCEICAAQLEAEVGEQEYTKADKVASCQQERKRLTMDIYQMCVLHEFGYRLNEQEAII